MGKLEKMKFAKILLIISAIAFVASRTVTKEEEEYMAETQALKVEEGYKELMQMTAATMANYKSTNWDVEVQIGNAKAQGKLANSLVYTNFQSGIPFIFTSAPAEGVAKHMVKYDKNTWYIPSNTVTKYGFAEKNRRINHVQIQDLSISNKHGTESVDITFTSEPADRNSYKAFNNFSYDWQAIAGTRKSFITRQFQNVWNNAEEASYNMD